MKPFRVFELFASSFDPFVLETRRIPDHVLKADKRTARILDIGAGSYRLKSSRYTSNF